MTLSACLNCQMCADHHCPTNPAYFAVHEAVRNTFEGDTLESVETRIEACPHWTLSETKAVTASLTLNLQQWNDCLQQLQSQSHLSDALIHIIAVAQTCLDPSSDRQIHEVVPASATSPDTDDEAIAAPTEASDTAESPDTSLNNVEAVEDGGAIATEETLEPAAEATILAPPTTSPEGLNHDSASEEAFNPAFASQSADTDITAPLSPTDPPSQDTMNNEAVEHSINALIDDFWSSTSSQAAPLPIVDNSPQAKVWRGSGRSTQPSEQFGSFIDHS